MIAVDTNILVYSHRADSTFYLQADRCVTELAEGENLWAIPWPCLYEFFAIVTHPRIYNPPTPLAAAITQVEAWLGSPHLQLIGEEGEAWAITKSLLLEGRVTGPQIHDAKIVSLCLQNGVKTLWSADRDFSRFKALEIINPLLK